MQLFFKENFNKENFLDEIDSRHCITVLRKKVGDTIKVCDGDGGLYDCLITKANAKKCELSIIDKKQFERPERYIHIAIAPTKNTDRIEYFVEKAIEIGISEISFLLCKNAERNVLKLDRIERIAHSAMKQSLHWYKPKINALCTFETFLKQKIGGDLFIAHLSEKSVDIISIAGVKNVCILVGPEGDFTFEELELAASYGAKQVSMGQSRLRTETAGVVAATLLNIC